MNEISLCATEPNGGLTDQTKRSISHTFVNGEVFQGSSPNFSFACFYTSHRKNSTFFCLTVLPVTWNPPRVDSQAGRDKQDDVYLVEDGGLRGGLIV